MSTLKQRMNKVSQIKEEDIDYTDIPELTQEFWNNAVITRSVPKKSVTIRLDNDVLEWLKHFGKGYQTRINTILKYYMKAQH
jgi:uncharacterized protein (DUF4415 family)